MRLLWRAIMSLNILELASKHCKLKSSRWQRFGKKLSAILRCFMRVVRGFCERVNNLLNKNK